jgi:hypothetical protein
VPSLSLPAATLPIIGTGLTELPEHSGKGADTIVFTASTGPLELQWLCFGTGQITESVAVSTGEAGSSTQACDGQPTIDDYAGVCPGARVTLTLSPTNPSDTWVIRAVRISMGLQTPAPCS